MLGVDEHALMCDFAETYHILDYKQLPPTQAAIFAAGLPEGSRIKKRVTRQSADLNALLLAGIVDRLSLLIWFETKDGQKGVNKPHMLVESLVGQGAKEAEVIVFRSSEDFEATRNKIVSCMRG